MTKSVHQRTSNLGWEPRGLLSIIKENSCASQPAVLTIGRIGGQPSGLPSGTPSASPDIEGWCYEDRIAIETE